MMHGPLSNQMSEAQFDAECAKLRERGETSIERTARWEQDLAKLYYRGGWTQEWFCCFGTIPPQAFPAIDAYLDDDEIAARGTA